LMKSKMNATTTMMMTYVITRAPGR
jgi:hypothetical protein